MRAHSEGDTLSIASPQSSLPNAIQSDVRSYSLYLTDIETPLVRVQLMNGALISSSGVPSSGASDSMSIGSGAAGSVSMGNAASGSATASGSAPMSSPASSGQALGLFSLAQLNMMRVYINIPQLYLMSIRVGQTANVTVREMPGQTFRGVIVRNAGVLDASSRTLVAEIRVNNQRQLLRPGMFADVRLRVPHPGGDVLIPDPSLVTNAQGNQVAMIGSDNKIHFQPITLGRDFGKLIEVTSGLQVGQKVVLSPSDTLVEGERVRVAAAQPQGDTPAGGGKPPTGGAPPAQGKST